MRKRIPLFTGSFRKTFIKHYFRWICVALISVSFTYVAAQDVTISPATGGLAGSPLTGGATNRAILGVQLVKAGGGTNAVTGFTVQLTEDPNGRFLNARLFRSDNGNSFDVADLANQVGTGSFSTTPNSIDFTGSFTNFANNAGIETRYLFVVVDIEPDASSALAPVVPSVAAADISVNNNSVLGGPVTGISYSFDDTTTPGITFNPADAAVNVSVSGNLTITFSEAVRKIDDSPITPADLLTLVELKITDDLGAPVTFVASIDVTNTIITIDPSANLLNNTVYYLEIDGLEDASNNATSETDITFSTPDSVPPSLTFSPADGATAVLETVTITITSNELLRRSDNTALSNGNIGAQVTLRETNAAGAVAPATVSINAGDNIITIIPSSILKSNQLYYVAINGVEDASNNTISPNPSSITFTTGDGQPPAATFNPANGANPVSVSSNITITFDEPILNIGGTTVDNANVASLLDLKFTNAAGAVEPFTATINAGKDVITIDPTATLTGGQLYYVQLDPIEDALGNASTMRSITFTTELPPSISPAFAGPTCVGESVTIGGNRFGTSLIIEPSVSINGVSADVTAHSNTSITFTVPVTTNGPIMVTNNENGLSTTSGTTTTINTINTELTVTPTNTSAALNGSAAISVGPTQSSVYKYRLVITSAPVGYTPAPVSTVDGPDDGNSGTLNFSTGTLDETGNYEYKITVARTGCTTRDITAGGIPVTINVNVAQLTAVAGVPTSICKGDSVILGSNPTVVGGTTFNQIRWYKLPSSTSFSSATNPQVKPTSTSFYRVVVNDGVTTASDTVAIRVNLPTGVDSLDIDLAPPKPNNTYQKEQTTPVVLTFELGGSPGPFLGSTHFEGPGVNTNGNPKVFYPNAANSGGNQIDLYYENPRGCITKDSVAVFIRDQNLFITGLDQSYCREDNDENVIANNPVIIPPFGFTFCFFGPCTDYTFLYGRRYTYQNVAQLRDGRDPLVDPLITDPNAFSYIGANITINSEYLSKGTKQIELYHQVEILAYQGAPPGYNVIGTYFEFVPVTFDVLEKPRVSSFIAPEVCVNDAPFVLNVDPPGGVFTLNGSPSTNTFNPGTSGLPDDNTVIYTYTDPSTSCFNSVQNNIHINRLPLVNILKQNGCVGDEITFTPVFINPTAINFIYSFNSDGIGGYDTTILNNTAVPLTRSYEVASTYPIDLQVVTDKKCVTGKTDNVTIGQVPDLNLSWYNVCDGDQTRFAFKSNFFTGNPTAADSIIWDFGNGITDFAKSPVLSDSAVTHLYGTTDYFNAYVTLTTDLNCRQTDSVRVYKVKKTGPIGTIEYAEDFNDPAFEDQGWKSGGTNSSWAWGAPSGTLINDDSSPGGGNAWVTNLSGTYNTNEDSWVHSPCFNLTAIQRPVLSVDLRSLTFERVDGAVLQYNTKNTTSKEGDWKTLGNLVTGKNWYNKDGIASNPGNQSLLQLGWTGKVDSSAWRKAIIPLDVVLSSIPAPERNRVRFRFAFGSSEFTSDGEGFAFDNFRISQRDRVVLLEQFTNNGGPSVPTEPNKVSNAAINNFLSTTSGEVIKLEYHIGVSGPDPDPIYENNSIDANARAAFYGVTSTPTPVIDSRTGNLANIFAEQTLKSAGVSIDTIFTPNTPVDQFNVTVTFTARQDLPPYTTLHIAVIEKQITDPDAMGTNGEAAFTYVMKKMLPDALGTRYMVPILKDEVRTETYSWNPKAYDFTQLAVVAFVQNENTKEIYQSRILTLPTHIPDPSVVTGTEPSFADQVHVYPNPANSELTIQLPKRANQVIPVSLTDGFGREVYVTDIKTGEQHKTLNTHELVPGVYVLQIKSGNGEVARKKVLVVH